MPLSSDRVSVLLVDDDEKKLLTLEAVLSDLGLDLVPVRSGRDALRKLLNQEFALILLDVNMPGMDGFETAEFIRQRQNCETTPIIFITAYGDDLFIKRGYSLGAVDFILAPIVPDVLRSKVSVFVELYRQTLEIRRQAHRLQHRAAQLSALANQLTEAEHRERRRLAQVLHDHLQQILVAAKMRLSAALPRDAPAATLGKLAPVDKLLDEAITASRSLAVELTPPILHDGGLSKAVAWLARKFEKDHGLRTYLQTPNREPALPEHVLSLLYQAVRELLFNIVKHAGVREAWVSVDYEGGLVRVVVEDRGAGFRNASFIEQHTPTDHFGLSSVRERLRFLGGDLQIRTREGEGTQITLIVPETKDGAEPTRPATPDVVLERMEPRDGVIRVMLADDHQMLRKGLVGLLGAHDDIEVIAEAADGEEAVGLATKLRPDVVVMDVNMPRLNGIDATRRISSALPGVRVIGLSMHDGTDTARAVREAGAVDYLNKDGPPDQLVAAIRKTRSSTSPSSNG